MGLRDLPHISHVTEKGDPTKSASSQLGDYDVLAELARGGMARVFLARRIGQSGFERLFAIKVLHEEILDDPEALDMLLDEANIASSIHHANAVPIIDIGEEGEYRYLVMEYAEGFTLFQLLRKHKKDRPARLIVPIMLDALRGLHAAHEVTLPDGSQSNLVHRDFSPANLIVSLDGTCRVTDFGIAKVEARISTTLVGQCKGKMSYMSPEQIAASKDIDRRADIWSAGVVLYNALTRTKPFSGSSPEKTIENILKRELPPASEIGLKPPSCLDTVCAKALQRRRADRYATALEMADELQRIAVKNDILGSPSEVASWVKSSFVEEIEQRRKAIRELKAKTTSSVRHLSKAILTSGDGPDIVRLEELDSDWLEDEESSADHKISDIPIPPAPPSGTKKEKVATKSELVIPPPPPPPGPPAGNKGKHPPPPPPPAQAKEPEARKAVVAPASASATDDDSGGDEVEAGDLAKTVTTAEETDELVDELDHDASEDGDELQSSSGTLGSDTSQDDDEPQASSSDRHESAPSSFDSDDDDEILESMAGLGASRKKVAIIAASAVGLLLLVVIALISLGDSEDEAEDSNELAAANLHASAPQVDASTEVASEREGTPSGPSDAAVARSDSGSMVSGDASLSSADSTDGGSAPAPLDAGLATVVDSSSTEMDSSVSGESEEAEMVLLEVPPNARILVDGQRSEENTFSLPRDGRRHVIRVDRPGYAPWIKRIVPSEDSTFTVRFRRPRKRSRSIVRNPGF